MKCYYHPNEDAVATCARCGVGLCRECAGKYKYTDGKLICRQCYETLDKENRAMENAGLQAELKTLKEHLRGVFLSALLICAFLSVKVWNGGMDVTIYKMPFFIGVVIVLFFFSLFFVESFTYLINELPLQTWNCLGQLLKLGICVFLSALLVGTVIGPPILILKKIRRKRELKRILGKIR
ncbi:MAG: hypothetical protein IKR52_04300 [Paludibacteraceae bacterium]|nr:hypothetical protein [Paludibacteraceae bacterium]MDD6357569.1 hypothetical protein [Bacteroidales bacterium]